MSTVKKFLDAQGVAYLASKLDEYPNNEILATIISAIQDALDEQAQAIANLDGGLGLSVDAQGYICQTIEVSENAGGD